MKGGNCIKMAKTKIISVSAPEDLITFCVEHSISCSEIFQQAVKEQREVWIKAHMETAKLFQAKQDLERMNQSHWDFLHEKGLELEYNKWRQEHGYC